MTTTTERTLSDFEHLLPDSNRRLTCTECGMVANIDPWLHAERYGHEPRIYVRPLAFVHRGDGAFALDVTAAHERRQAIEQAVEQERSAVAASVMAVSAGDFADPNGLFNRHANHLRDLVTELGTILAALH